MILAVDLGNYNIKTSELICFTSRFTKSGSVSPIDEETIVYSNEHYVMLKGAFDNEFNKHNKNYMPNLLYAIAKSVKEEKAEIDLVLGVPLDNLSIRTDFREDLEGKTFTFLYNGKEMSVTIKKLATVGEGLSAFYTLSNDDMLKDVMILDIGGRTVNVATFVQGRLESKATLPVGTINYYDTIKTRLNELGNNYEVEEIERIIKRGTIDNVDEDGLSFMSMVINKLKFKFKLNTYDLFLTGGGSIDLKDAIEKLLPNSKFLDNPIFSNVNGNKRVALKKWGEE